MRTWKTAVMGILVSVGLGFIFALWWGMNSSSTAKQSGQGDKAPLLVSGNEAFLKRAQADLTASDSDNGRGRQKLVNTLYEWAMQDTVGASEWARKLPDGSARVDSIRAVSVIWARTDPRAALAYAAKYSHEKPHDFIYNGILAEWAQSDFEGAYTWALKSGDRAVVFLPMVVSHVPPDSFPQAAEWIAGISDEHLRLTLTGVIARQWAIHDEKASLAWANGLQGKFRDLAVGDILAQIGSEQPEEASRLVKALPTGDGKVLAIAVLAGQWADEDPKAAARWLMGFPEKSEKLAGIESLIRKWAQSDSKKAERWLNGLPKGAVRDTGVGSFVGIVSQTDPKTAASYALTISDATERESSVLGVVRAWQKKDPRSAKIWLDSKPEAAEWKKKLSI